jgi:hypothetical protein
MNRSYSSAVTSKPTRRSYDPPTCQFLLPASDQK